MARLVRDRDDRVTICPVVPAQSTVQPAAPAWLEEPQTYAARAQDPAAWTGGHITRHTGRRTLQPKRHIWLGLGCRLLADQVRRARRHASSRATRPELRDQAREGRPGSTTRAMSTSNRSIASTRRDLRSTLRPRDSMASRDGVYPVGRYRTPCPNPPAALRRSVMY
jgi:hypothetical protein